MSRGCGVGPRFIAGRDMHGSWLDGEWGWRLNALLQLLLLLGKRPFTSGLLVLGRRAITSDLVPGTGAGVDASTFHPLGRCWDARTAVFWGRAGGAGTVATAAAVSHGCVAGLLFVGEWRVLAADREERRASAAAAAAAAAGGEVGYQLWKQGRLGGLGVGLLQPAVLWGVDPQRESRRQAGTALAGVVAGRVEGGSAPLVRRAVRWRYRGAAAGLECAGAGSGGCCHCCSARRHPHCYCCHCCPAQRHPLRPLSLMKPALPIPLQQWRCWVRGSNLVHRAAGRPLCGTNPAKLHGPTHG
eukprot:1161873-Pelagomonas_calceolata.AAC.6